jgi:hypothetical protein
MTQEAWAAMYTGRSPSEINVVALPRDPDRVSTLKGINAQTIFEVLGEVGMRIGCIGMPMTFPVNKIDVFMMAGFPITAPQYRVDEEYFYPPAVKEIVESSYYPYLWANEENRPLKEDVTYKAIEQSIMEEKDKINCVTQIMTKLGCFDLDFLAIGFSFTDIAAHCRRVYPIEKTYQAADEILQRILETFKFDNLLIISDHGLPMMPWRGDPFDEFAGLGHHRYGTCICVGKDIETSLNLVKMRRRLSSRIFQCIRDLKHILLFREYWGLFNLHNIVDITEIYALIANIFGLPLTSKLLKRGSEYSANEIQSIKNQLELLGYM